MEGSGRGLILSYYSSTHVERLIKTTKNSVRIAYIQAQILTRDLPNTKQEC
jgi:hypothetical protein